MQKRIKTVFRIVSTLLLVLGIALVVLHITNQKVTLSSELLAEPSYYTTAQSGHALLVSGICVMALGALSSFLSWLKVMDVDENVMPNAGYSDIKDIRSWLGGSSLDAERNGKKPAAGRKRSEHRLKTAPDKTVLENEDKTTVDDNTVRVDEAVQTVIEDETTVCGEDSTLICDGDDTVVCGDDKTTFVERARR